MNEDAIAGSSLRGGAFLLCCCATSYALVRFLPPLSFLKRPASSIVSYGSLHAHSPAENLALYGLALAIAAAVAALILRGGTEAPPAFPGDWSRPMRAMAIVLLVAAAVNASWIDPAAPMVDPFHEGETLAFGPAFRAPGGLAGAMLIHGPGIDLLPALIGSWLRPGAAIATTRSLRALEGLLLWAGLSWGIWELLGMGGAARLPRWMKLALLLLCSVPLAATGFTAEMARKSVLALQFALLARMLRRGARAPLAVALGASAPAGFLYNYLEGLAGAVLIGAGAVLWWWRGERRAVIAAACAALAACSGAALLAGPTCVAACAQFAYWARDGQMIWGLPLRKNQPVVLVLLFGPIVALHAAACVRLWRGGRATGSWREAALAQADLLLALLLSASCARSWIDRADDAHLELAAWTSLPLLLVLARPALARAAASTRARVAASAAVCAVPLVAFGGLRTADPTLAAVRIRDAVVASATPDGQVVSASYVEAARMLSAELPAGECFWTLTSEGIWYHLLDRPSCTRFHQVVYARAADAQAEVVADLERARPRIILFANEEWWNRVDGVPVSVTNARIHAYVLSHYRPWRRVGEHWFWKRARAPLARDPAGCVAGAVARAQITAGIARVSGRVDAPGRVVYLVSPDGQPRAADEPGADGRWVVEVPEGDAFVARAYAYDGARDVLVPLCAPAPGQLEGAQAGSSHG